MPFLIACGEDSFFHGAFGRGRRASIPFANDFRPNLHVCGLWLHIDLGLAALAEMNNQPADPELEAMPGGRRGGRP